jgi:hypothetical protein
MDRLGDVLERRFAEIGHCEVAPPRIDPEAARESDLLAFEIAIERGAATSRIPRALCPHHGAAPNLPRARSPPVAGLFCRR